MAKIRIRTFVMDGKARPAMPAISLGNQLLEEPQVIEGVDLAGKPMRQRKPGRSECLWLVPPGTQTDSTHVDIADVPDDVAAILVDERGWCERVAGRPRGAGGATSAAA